MVKGRGLRYLVDDAFDELDRITRIQSDIDHALESFFVAFHVIDPGGCNIFRISLLRLAAWANDQVPAAGALQVQDRFKIEVEASGL